MLIYTYAFAVRELEAGKSLNALKTADGMTVSEQLATMGLN
jgi:hypothetical protein